MDAIPSDIVVVDFGCFDELVIMFSSEERIGKLSKELFEKTSYAVDVVEESFRIAKVDAGGVCALLAAAEPNPARENGKTQCSGGLHTIVKYRLELIYVVCVTAQSVNPLNFKTEKLDSLNALVDNHRHSRIISFEQRLERLSKYRLDRRKTGRVW